MSLPMSSTSSFYSSSPPPRSYPKNSTRRRGVGLGLGLGPRRRANGIGCALRRDASFGHGYEGKLVDEDMIVLRMRIHEMKTRDETRDAAPSNWMDWEKKYYNENYDSDICEAVGVLQSQLMNTRPGLALASLGLLSLSVPISMGVILLHLVHVANQVLVGFHL